MDNHKNIRRRQSILRDYKLGFSGTECVPKDTLVSSIDNVENPCKTPWKTSCEIMAKPCKTFIQSHITRAKLHFPTDFFNSLHRLFHRLPTPILKLFYPLFHSPYYINYLYLNNRKEG